MDAGLAAFRVNPFYHEIVAAPPVPVISPNPGGRMGSGPQVVKPFSIENPDELLPAKNL